MRAYGNLWKVKIINSVPLTVHFGEAAWMGSEEQLPQGPPLSVGLSFLSHVCLDSKLSVCPTQRFSDRGSVPPGAIWQCLETFLMLTPEERCCWHLRGRGRGCCPLLCDTQAACYQQRHGRGSRPACVSRSILVGGSLAPTVWSSLGTLTTGASSALQPSLTSQS